MGVGSAGAATLGCRWGAHPREHILIAGIGLCSLKRRELGARRKRGQ